MGLAACGSSEAIAPPLVVVEVPPAGSASTAVQVAELHPVRVADPSCCKGRNECRGLGNCRSATGEGCRGQNECKGKGGCRPRVCPPFQQIERACCKGQNECKGKGGCKTDGNECKGLNECKGKGGCKSGEGDC